MAISNELSGDIAAAILGMRKLSAGEKLNLKETLLKIHSTLQQMSEDDRRHIEPTSSGQSEAAAKAHR